MRARSWNRSGDQEVAELARRQHGVVSRSQLLQLGLSASGIGRRIEAGRLHRVHRGVYAVGHPLLSREGRWQAAVLSVGPGAVLSHRSAAALWGVRHTLRPDIEITVGRSLGSRAGITIRCSVIPADEVTIRNGIPVTTVPRTLIDLAAVLTRREVERALREVEVRRLTDPLTLGDLLSRYPRRPSAGRIRGLLSVMDPALTRSELEERFLTFLERYALPRPEVNASIKARGLWFEVDCLWRNRRLVVELDGRQVHATASAFEVESGAGPRPRDGRVARRAHHLAPASR